MLNENLKYFRKKKGLSQEELAVQLNVVRQTVSKWEKGLSVPDSEMLCTISEVLEVSTGTLLGKTVESDAESGGNDVIQALAEKLEVINAQLAKRNEQRRIFWRVLCILIAVFGFGSLAVNIILQLAIQQEATSLGVIGGADGPTAIFITRSLSSIFNFLPLLLLLVGALIGIYKTKPKDK